MALKSFLASEEIARYVCEGFTKETAVQKKLRAETAGMPNGQMQISADQGALMALLVKMMGAKKCLEVGVFTGYSALTVAAALPADGRLIACDVSEEWTGIARQYWKEAGVEGKIELRLAPALETLKKMLAGGEAGTFDFAFVDADKESYDAYYEAVLKLLRKGGVMLIDNVVGKGIAEGATAGNAKFIRPLNDKIRDDARVEAAMVAIGGGFMVVWKKER
jgi:predicted O-methyltransferase YrrM